MALSRLAAHLAAHPDLPLAPLLAELEAASHPLDHPALRPPARPVAGGPPGASLGSTFARSYDRLAADDPVDTLAQTLLHRVAWCVPGVPIPDPCALRLTGLDPAAPDDHPRPMGRRNDWAVWGCSRRSGTAAWCCIRWWRPMGASGPLTRRAIGRSRANLNHHRAGR